MIDAPYFYAAVVLDHRGRVERAAPIIKYMIGWDRSRVLAYAKSKRWKATVLE